MRDALLGRTPEDWDVATAATPQQAAAALSDYRILETGLRHGTVTALADGMPVEITTYRTEGAYSDGRRPDAVFFTQSLEKDLARRDFTVNAMAYGSRGFVDRFHGREDLSRGILRCVGDPILRFREDSLRILRGIRFTACLGLSPEPETARAALVCRAFLSRVSAERIGNEFRRMLCGPFLALALPPSRPVWEEIFPELAPGAESDGVWARLNAALPQTAPDLLLRLAVFFREWDALPDAPTGGDPSTAARAALRRLRCGNAEIDAACRAICLRSHPLPCEGPAVKRLLRQWGEPALRRAAALQAACGPPPGSNPAGFLSAMQTVLARRECYSLRMLAVGGEELRAHGIPAGPLLGSLLERLLEAVIEGVLPNEKEPLLAAAVRWKEEIDGADFPSVRTYL